MCHETISVLKEYNIKRHYITKHKEYENMTGEARKEKNILLLIYSKENTFVSDNSYFCDPNLNKISNKLIIYRY